jgi:GNAT superfamily N-acetyltransferase
MRSLLGRPRSTLRDAADLAGAPDDARVTVAVVPIHGRRIIEIRADSDLIELRLSLYRGPDGNVILEDDQLDASEDFRRRGHGTRLIGRQVEHAIRLGVAEIRGCATRNERTGDVGYWVWPLIGFDGNRPGAILDRLPPDLAGARRVGELVQTGAGRRWWLENGDSITVVLELTPRSPSFRRFRDYLRREGLP